MKETALVNVLTLDQPCDKLAETSYSICLRKWPRKNVQLLPSSDRHSLAESRGHSTSKNVLCWDVAKFGLWSAEHPGHPQSTYVGDGANERQGYFED